MTFWQREQQEQQLLSRVLSGAFERKVEVTAPQSSPSACWASWNLYAGSLD